MAYSEQRTEKLLDLIYEAASEPDLWRTVLTEIADLTGSQGGILFGQSLGAQKVYFDFNGRLSEECNRVYQERHMRNVWSVGMEQQPVGRLVLSDELVPLASLRRTAFFDDVLRPQDIAHNTMTALAAKADFRAAFNLCRSKRQGPMQGEAYRLLQTLVPHMRRSARLGFHFDAYRTLQRVEYDVLDRLTVAVILLDRAERVIYANKAARFLCSAGGALRLRNSSLTAQSAAHSQRLDELIAMSMRNAATGTMSLPQPGDGPPLTVLVSSVRGGTVGRFTDLGLRDAAVMLFIVDPTKRTDLPTPWLMDAYDLTQAEARVALIASSGVSIPETAQRLGLSVNTVKTHLRKVFAKTSTHRQSDLARLIASLGLLASP